MLTIITIICLAAAGSITLTALAAYALTYHPADPTEYEEMELNV